MSHASFPFAVRLIGFHQEEARLFEATFAVDQGKGYGYFHLAEDNLQDPDLYVINVDDVKGLVALADLPPSDVRPVLLIGSPGIELPYLRVDRPIRWPKLFEALDRLVEKRADALSRLEASDIISVPERRRRERLDIDFTNPSEYSGMRGKTSMDGSVLVVDRNPAFRAYLSDLLAGYQIPVAWVSDEAKATEMCAQQHVAVVMINTSAPDIDPYRLCKSVKKISAVKNKTTVIFLVSKPFVYDSTHARAAGADGYLNKPVATHHLISVLKKFLPALSK